MQSFIILSVSQILFHSMGDRENPDKSRATPGRMNPADLRAMLEQYTYAECVRLWEQGRLHWKTQGEG